MTILADSLDRVVMELYNRPDEMKTEFSNLHPLTFHVAFVSAYAQEDSLWRME